MTYTLSFSEIGKEDVRIVGGKAASLGEMYQAKFPVPLGFAITAEAFSDLRNKDLPKSFTDELMKQFDALQAERVSVRSSALAEDSADASWAGQMETYLNVTRDQLIDRIKDCWDSVDSERAKVYAAQNDAKSGDLLVGVVVQKMIDSESAGVMFTANPVDGNRNELMIEAGYGLGEGVVSGIITPDNYILARPRMEIVHCNVSNQAMMVAREDNQTKTVDVPQDKQSEQKLSDSDIKLLANIGVRIEEHYSSPQDIEWAYMDGELYILQSRPITTLNQVHHETQVIAAEPLTSGVGASQGVVTGKVRVITELDDLKSVEEGEILACYTTTPDYVEIFPKLAGIITESGGATNHAAVVSREMGIPAVVGTKNITQKVKTGDVVTLDGAAGYVYLGSVELSDEVSGGDFIIPTPSSDEIQDLIDSITAVINNPNELWPLPPYSLMPYIESDQSMDMFVKLKQLYEQGMSDADIAALFGRPILAKNFLLNTAITGMKAANKFENRATIDDQMELTRMLLRIAKVLNKNDPNYIVSRNLLWDEKEKIEFVDHTVWTDVTKELARDIGVLSVNLLALNWSLYWNYFAETGHELHGPYEVEGFKPNSRMVVKDYYNLSTDEIWEFGKDFPYSEIRLAQIYDTDKMYLSFGIRLSGHDVARHNTHFALFVDGKPVNDPEKIREIALKAKEVADKQTKYINGLEPLEIVRKGAKISYFARKNFYLHFNDEWYPEDMVEGTIKAIGSDMANSTRKAKPMSMEDRKILWDPRTDTYPDGF